MAARQIRTILKVKGAGAIIAVALLISVSYFYNLNFLRARVEAQASRIMEEEVDVNGNIKLGFAGWRPALVMHQVEIRNLSLSARAVAVSPLMKERIFIRVDSLSYDKTFIGDYTLPVRIIPDGFEILGLKGKVAGGKIRGDITYPGDKFKLSLSADDIDYAEVTDWAKGTAKIRLEAEGRGLAFRQVMGSLDGHFTLVGGKGRLSSSAVSFWTKDLLRSIVPGSKTETALNCVIADFNISNGIARHQVVVVDTDDAVIIGKGKVDLIQQKIDMIFTPNPKDMALFSMATPVRVSGTPDNISVQPAAGGVAKKIGGFLLGAVNPAMALLPLISAGSGDDAGLCAKYLQKP